MSQMFEVSPDHLFSLVWGVCVAGSALSTLYAGQQSHKTNMHGL